MKKTFKVVLVMLLCMLTLSATMMSASAVAGPTVAIKSVATSSVTVYWTKVSTALSYDIQRTTDGKTWSSLATGVKATEYTDTKSLTTGVSYGYRVRAKFLIGTSDWSSMAVGKPVPPKVTGLKVTAANNTAVRLVWDKVAGVSGYTVQYYGSGKWNNYKSVTANTIDVTGLKLGTNYHFRVAAVKVVSSKWIYGAVSDYITTTPVLAATTKVALTGVNATQMRIQWLGVSGAKGFEIFNHTTGTWTDAGAATGIILSGFKPGETCSFTVRAYAGSVKGKESAKYTFKTAPATPSGLALADATDNSLTFSWDAVNGANGYQPRYYDYATQKWTNLSLTAGTSATVTGLKGKTQYAFQVRAYVENKDVHNISVYATSAWTAYINVETVLPATKLAAVTSTSTTDVGIKWSAVTGATGYVIEKYEAATKSWSTYDFKSASWKSAANINENSEIVTTALSFTDSGKTTRSDVFRVRAVDEKGNKGTASNLVTAFTKDVLMNNTAGTFVVQQTIRWPAAPGAVSYNIVVRNPAISSTDLCTFEASKVTRTDGTCQANIYLAPNSIHSLMILYTDSSGRTNTATNWVTFNVGDVPILASNHQYYVASVNSQLLYLAQAINNTKGYNGNITVKNSSKISYSVNSLRIPILFINKKTAEEVEEFFRRYDKEGELPTSSSEIFDATLNFSKGSAINEDGRTVKLRTFIEPSANDTQTAYLYNSQNYTAWKNGFDSVTSKKNADGSITMQLKFKQETTDSYYHNGFMSSFSASDFTGGQGLSVKNLAIGKSTLTVTIDKDGYLKSYVASSPYAATFAASFTTDEDIKEEGGINIIAGSLVSMEMGIAGNTEFNFTFSR